MKKYIAVNECYEGFFPKALKRVWDSVEEFESAMNKLRNLTDEEYL